VRIIGNIRFKVPVVDNDCGLRGARLKRQQAKRDHQSAESSGKNRHKNFRFRKIPSSTPILCGPQHIAKDFRHLESGEHGRGPSCETSGAEQFLAIVDGR
jgi:hypothetical protein